MVYCLLFSFQAEDGIRDVAVTGVQTCALPISPGVGHHDVLVGDQHGHGPLAGELLDLAAAARHQVEEARPDPEAADLDHVRIVARHPECLIGVVARVIVRGARRLEGASRRRASCSEPYPAGSDGRVTTKWTSVFGPG